VSRKTREDVVAAAGRLFAERGYHGTSMRDLGAELGLLGSSLYSHVAGKQELLVEVVERGAALFQAAAAAAVETDGDDTGRLRAFIAGHVDVVLDHIDETRTFLNEAEALDPEFRKRIVAARDAYEVQLRAVLAAGADSGTFRSDLDPKLAGIFVLSILNAVDRWYSEDGVIDRGDLVDQILGFLLVGIR
jgi:AcrR family transcriptional regulator